MPGQPLDRHGRPIAVGDLVNVPCRVTGIPTTSDLPGAGRVWLETIAESPLDIRSVYLAAHQIEVVQPPLVEALGEPEGRCLAAAPPAVGCATCGNPLARCGSCGATWCLWHQPKPWRCPECQTPMISAEQIAEAHEDFAAGRYQNAQEILSELQGQGGAQVTETGGTAAAVPTADPYMEP